MSRLWCIGPNGRRRNGYSIGTPFQLQIPTDHFVSWYRQELGNPGRSYGHKTVAQLFLEPGDCIVHLEYDSTIDRLDVQRT